MSDRFILKLKNQKAIFLNGVSVYINSKIVENDVLEVIENLKKTLLIFYLIQILILKFYLKMNFC